ncbi:Inner membrane transport permease YbhR [bacterium HR29]|jgi:ABC-2 type transport system permease protein|nr:Inner membrane transport permease YbhR [bacterium HR29]
MGAVLALAVRDLRGVLRSRSQLYSSMLTPLLILLFLGTGVSHGLEPANLPAGDFTAYLVAGVVVMTSVFSSTFSSASYYRDRDTGMLRALLVTPRHPRAIVLGKSLAGVAIGSLQAMVVLALAAPFSDLGWQYGYVRGALLALGVVVALNLLLGGLAQALATRIQTMQGFHLVMNLALFPLLFFSGAFFPIRDLPVWLEGLALANPLTYAVDALHVAVYANDSSEFLGLWIDLPVIGGLAVAAYAAGLARMPRPTWSGR